MTAKKATSTVLAVAIMGAAAPSAAVTGRQPSAKAVSATSQTLNTTLRDSGNSPAGRIDTRPVGAIITIY